MVIRESYEKNLQELQSKMTEMVDLTVESLEKAFSAFKEQDNALALKVIEEDEEIDEIENDINQFIIWLMVKEQPVARDLRQVIGILKIASDIERIADFSVNIAKSTIRIGTANSLLHLTDLESMKELSIDMLNKSFKSFISENMGLAKEVSQLDDKVDELYEKNYMAITDYLKGHPEDTTQLVQLLFINRYLERVADHITNVAESAAYLIKGRIYDFNA